MCIRDSIGTPGDAAASTPAPGRPQRFQRVDRPPGDRLADDRRRAPGDRSLRGRDGERRDRGRPGDRRDRDAPRRPPERKLYALEAVVDRGFEDLEEADDGAVRRVHWTILKRSVADQKSGKPMSATYVLRREESETEFPSLGAARAAVQKTIVHPEKLTRPKAEYAKRDK